MTGAKAGTDPDRDEPPLLGRGFVDAAGLAEQAAQAAAIAAATTDAAAGMGQGGQSAGATQAETVPQSGPMLLQPRADAPARVDTGWAPEAVVAPRVRGGAAGSVALGLIVLLGSWALLSLLSFVAGLLAQSLPLGLLAVVAMAVGVALVARGAVLELRAWRSLARVEQLRALLAAGGTPVAEAREAALAWLERVGAAVPERARVERTLREAGSAAEVRAVLRSQVADRLREAAGRLGRRAAMDGAALVAVCPSKAWDGVLAGGRGVLVVRQVAALYGLRPGTAVTLALLRRVAWTAAGTAGIDLVSQGVANQVLGNMPVLKRVFEAIPGSSAAAFRLYNLAGVTARACSPVE